MTIMQKSNNTQVNYFQYYTLIHNHWPPRGCGLSDEANLHDLSLIVEIVKHMGQTIRVSIVSLFPKSYKSYTIHTNVASEAL